MADFPLGTRVAFSVGERLITGRIGAMQEAERVYVNVDFGQIYSSRWVDKERLNILPPATDVPLLKVYACRSLATLLVVVANDEREAKILWGGEFPLLPLPDNVVIWQGVVATGLPRILHRE